MKNLITQLNAILTFTIILCCSMTHMSGQIKKEFEPRFSETVNGNMTMIANNVLSRHATNDYDGTAGNHDFDNNVFVDIDNDNSTFNSSRATLVDPVSATKCLTIKKAFLYWAAADKEEDNSNDEPNWNYNQVKLMLPSQGSYTTITADDVIYRGRDEHFVNDPYICFKDITTQVKNLSDPFGTYQIANVRAKEGELTGHGGGNVGTSGGWEIVFIYENPTFPKKNITIFDGYAHVTSSENNFNILFDGFLTVPTGDVNTSVLIGGLEGDRDLKNDKLQIRNTNNNWVNISTGNRPSDNFFNSKITKDGSDFTDRSPKSLNTLGFDAAVFELDNSNNSIIDNNQTSATMRLTSDQETYGLFLLGLAVDVWEPNMSPIVLQTNFGTNTTVSSNDNINFSFDVENNGNDDAVNLVVTTQIPEEVDFIEANVPNGVSYTYNNGLLTFTVNDDSLTEINASGFSIAFKLKVKEKCYFITTKCSDSFQIQLQASYNGVMNPAEDTVVSSSGTDNCGIGNNLPNVFTINQPAEIDWLTGPNDLDRTISCEDTQGLADAQNLAPQLDDCNVTPIKTTGQFEQSNTCPSNGTYTNTWVYTDICGRTTSTFTQTITIQDNTAPVLASAPADITVECIEDVPAMIDLAYTDNCDANGTVTGVDSALNGNACGGTITRTWNVSDACGNPAVEVSQIITIQDNTAPVFASAPADITVECIEDVPAMIDLAYTDNCDANGTVTGVDSALNGNACGGTITRTWNVSDACGNPAVEVSQTITIQDNTAPVLASAPADITVECIEDVPAMIDLAYTDNCDANGTVTGVDSALNGNACGGTITRTWNVSDACGNPAVEVSQTITIQDNTAPVLASAPADITVECIEDVPAMIDLAYTDNCDASGTITGVDSALNGNACGGTITRTWNVSDACGNPAVEVSQTITIQDNTAPVLASAPADITVECIEDVPAMIDLAYTDNCDANGTVTGVDSTLNGNACGGTITRTWNVSDACGNPAAEVSQTITIQDNTAPVLASAPADITVECIEDVPAMIDLAYTDNCDANGTVTGVDSTLNGNACGGTITRTWNVSDACGNPAIEVSQIITIQDNTAPDVTSCTLSNTVLECSDSTSNESAANNWDANNIALLQACATDNCDTDLTITSDFDYSNLNTSCGPCGSLSVTYTITDDCGNTSQINAILSFDDITIPDLSDCNVNSLTLECDGDNNETLASQWNDANIAALEACADDLNITVTSNYDYNNFNVSCGLSGNLPVTYTITDDCNNSAYVNVTLTFIDTTNPIFNESLPQNATVECDSIPNLVELTVTDSCDNSVEVNFSEVVTNQDDDCSNNYTITRTWVANDCAGNSIEHVQVINVIDTTAPTFDVSSLPQDVTLECSDDIPALEDAIVTATDNCSNIDDIVVTPSEVITNQDDDCSNNYTITRTWVANDCAGNSVEHVQIITMIDTTAPTFDVSSLPQDVTLECSDDIPALEDAIVTATDNCSNIDDIVITPSEVITNQDDDCSNNYTITRTWVANDCAGNSIEHVQVINVIDTTAPTFDVSSLPLNVTLECSDDIPALEDAIVTATDNCSNVDDIVITPSEVITNQDDDCSNNYTITRTWVANDCAGNSIEHVQVITVVDTTAPTLSSLPSNATVECDSIPDAETISATDNCDNNLTVQFDEQIIADPNGCATNYTINRTWSVTDCAGNTTAHTQVITVEDNSEPVLSGDIPADLTVECDTIPDAAVLSVEDNCGNNIPIAFTETISGNDDECANNYIITRTWTVTDCAGNSTQHVQVITVIDTTAPTFDVSSLPQDVTLECSDDIPALEDAIVTATDNCSNINDIVITPSEVITNQDDDCSNNYTITRTWVANDCAGNSVEHVQVINVIDTMGPTFDVSSLPQDVTLECSDDIPALEDITITATDNCSNVDDIVITPSEVITNQDDDCSNNYTITRTWVANDCAGNSVEHVQVINVIDTTAPTFDVSSLPQDVTLECSDDIPVLENVIVTATDNCSNVDDIVITPSEVITNQDDDCSNNYTITRTWIANDCSGNSIEHVQVINVIDTTAPTFDISTLPQDAVLECNDPIPALEDIIVRATDNCTESKDIIITANEVITHQDDNCSNNYTITRTWAANDCAGNSIEHVQVITVVDTTPPMLSGGDDGSAECTGTDPSLNDEYIAWRDSFANTTATDNCGEATLIITEGEWIEEGCSYSMTVQISATDECGLISETQERTFIISDTTAPEILNDLDDVVFYCNEVPPVQELDIEEECSEATIVFTETTEGSQGLDDYQIIRTWVITDDCGNETIREQILLVEPGCDCLEDKFITKAITPNGDVYNDYFKVEGIDDCGIPSLKIFNRWGALVYQSDNYDSKKGRWRGTSQGGITIGGNNELPTGTYYYIIEIKNRDIKPITGHVYLSTK